MKLQALASTPQLVEISITDPKIVERYGETIEFYVYDRQDLDVYMRMSALKDDDSLATLTSVVKDMIYNESGEPILKEGQTLPLDIMMRVIEETVKHLGNLTNPTSKIQMAS